MMSVSLNRTLLATALCVGLGWGAACLPVHAQMATAAPALQLAIDAEAMPDPTHWWVSEKLDGVRAFWDGSVLRFRSGGVIAAPAWFVAGLPRQALDGELWMGRGRFAPLSGAVRRLHPDDDEWRAIQYRIFDLPEAPGDFSARIEAMRAVVAAAALPWLAVVAQHRVADRAALQAMFDAVVQQGGEGLMLHRADALWQAGRGDALLKLKPWFDAEARVVAHVGGRGKHEGRLGALVVALPDGRLFRLGTGFSDAERRDPPPVGATVTYRYRGETATGLPRFASFVRQRTLP